MKSMRTLSFQKKIVVGQMPGVTEYFPIIPKQTIEEEVLGTDHFEAVLDYVRNNDIHFELKITETRTIEGRAFLTEFT